MLGHELAGIALAIISGAVLIAALSSKANTAGVISASTDGFAKLVGAVTAPVTG
jgi:hypothetical protein